MKKGIHPQYNSQATLTCSCGAKWSVGAVKDLDVESCSQCHPFYTGKQKIASSAGRIARFSEIEKKMAEKQEARKSVKTKEEKQQAKVEKKEKK